MSSQQRQSTFFRAIGAFVEHSLQVALLQLEKVRSYENIVDANFDNDEGRCWSPTVNLERLVQFLHEVTTTPLSMENLGRKLAIMDRLQHAVMWSTKWRCLSTNSRSHFRDSNVYAFSARMLMFSDESANRGDEALDSEWQLASQLCEASVNIIWRHSEGFTPHYKECGSGMVGVCQTILLLLDAFPTLLPGDSYKVISRYKDKQYMAEWALRLENERQFEPCLQSPLQYQRADETPQMDASYVEAMSNLFDKSAVVVTKSVSALAHGVRGNALVPHVHARLRAARAVQPCTKYQQKIIKCLERAASAENPYESDCYVRLAEGIFTSVVTCHTQWERAVQRRDGKLADFWQRARERAWAVGCESQSHLVTTRAMRAVHLAECAQALLLQNASSPLHQAEADVSFLVCDLLMAAESPGRKYCNKEDFIDMLYHAMGCVYQLLCGLNSARARSCPLAFLGGETIVTPPYIDEVLLWAAMTVTTLYAHKREQDAPAAAERAAACLHALPALLYKPDRIGDVTQLMFVADLSIWSLQLHDAGDLLGSWALDTLANAYPEIVPPNQFFATAPPRGVVGVFRLQLTAALEAALLDVCPHLQRELGERWPQHRRQWLGGDSNIVPAVQPGTQASDAIDELVQTVLNGARWQETCIAESDPELQMIAAEVVVKTAEVTQYRLKSAELALRTGPWSQHTEWLLRAAKLVMRALELQHQALQAGYTVVSAQYRQVCEFLLPITSRGEKLFDLIYHRKYPFHVPSALCTMAALCRRGDMQLCAVSAQLGGRSDIAAIWLAAAKAFADGVSYGEEDELDERALPDLDAALERAEALAEQARRAESEEERLRVDAVVVV
jgi:hypothetical protein